METIQKEVEKKETNAKSNNNNNNEKHCKRTTIARATTATATMAIKSATTIANINEAYSKNRNTIFLFLIYYTNTYNTLYGV